MAAAVAAAAAPQYEPEPAPEYEPAATPEYEPENTANGLDFEDFDDDFGETRPLTGSGSGGQVCDLGWAE